MKIPRILVTSCLVAGSVIALAACGSSSNNSSGTGTSGGGGGAGTINVYSDLPLKGAVSAQTKPALNGEMLALSQAHYKAGQYKINFISMDDATATSPTNYDLNLCAADARRVASDSNAVYMVGPFNSGCAEVEIPITNQSGVAEVSPANTYVGLTTNGVGSASGEPQKYYPTGKRNYLRIVPRDSLQGTAGDVAMKQAGCKRVAIANDKTPYGAGLADQIKLNAGKEGLTVTGNTQLDPTAPNYRAYASSVKGQGANCVYTAFNPPGEVQLIKDINAALPKANIFGGDGVCSGGETNPAQGGFPKSIAPLFHYTVATLGLSGLPGGKEFLAAYKAKYGVSNPDPYAVYGYEAMKVGLDTLASLGSKANDKAAVTAAMFKIKNRQSVIGTYGFDQNGDTSITAYGLYKVGSDGNPEFVKAVG
ncbi:MAG: branched-chain amino acid ABC transporter substrate-binding protein [Solirubrobacteraceae bacterium]